MDIDDYDRVLLQIVETALTETRVVALIGARQVGKTSLARTFASADREFVSLDERGPLSQAQSDPDGFVRALGPRAIVDEIQRVPELLLAMKAVVDRDRTKGRFLVTGSADVTTLERIADSLAGRMTVLELMPLAQCEIERVPCNVVDTLFDSARSWKAATCDRADVARRVVRGGYPEAVLLDAAARDRWFASYTAAMIVRDVRNIANISDVAGIGRLFAVSAARTARAANYTSLSSETGVPKSTLLRYISLLEQTFLLYRMPAWSLDLGRRLTKLPKLFIADTGVAAHLVNADAARLLADGNVFGSLLETFVANELRKHASWSDRRVSIYHYRELDGREVDFILESADGTRVAVEVKSTSSPTRSDAKGVLNLMDDARLRLTRAIVVHTGDAIVPIRENVHGVPISAFWTKARDDA